MFAVIEIGGQQLIVRPQDKIKVNKLGIEEGETIKIAEVLLISDDEAKNAEIGTPFLEGSYVEAKSLGDGRGEKIRVFKMKAKKRYRKTQGHRQDFTELEIIKIGKGKATPAKKAEAKKEEKEEKAEAPVKKAPAKKPAIKKAPAKKKAE